MPRKLQAAYTHAPTRRLVTIGDSLTHNPTLGVPPEKFWTAVLAAKLNALGCTVTAANRGRNGDTTANSSPNMMYRSAWLFANGTPDLAFVWGGANDPGASISTAQTTANLQALVKALKFGVTATAGAGYVAGQANLPANVAPGTRYVVLADSDTTGGAAAATGQTAGIAGTVAADGAGNKQAVWESRNGQAGVAGWGRVAVAATTPTHCPRVVIGGMHYLNFSTGGDTTTVKYAPYDDVTGVRAAQIAAAAAEGVVYSDRYAFLKARVVAGTDAQGSFSWHYADANQHLNAYGNELVARCDLATIQAQTGWVAALTA